MWSMDPPERSHRSRAVLMSTRTQTIVEQPVDALHLVAPATLNAPVAAVIIDHGRHR